MRRDTGLAGQHHELFWRLRTDAWKLSGVIVARRILMLAWRIRGGDFPNRAALVESIMAQECMVAESSFYPVNHGESNSSEPPCCARTVPFSYRCNALAETTSTVRHTS